MANGGEDGDRSDDAWNGDCLTPKSKSGHRYPTVSPPLLDLETHHLLETYRIFLHIVENYMDLRTL
jgi:hypothetical protein